MRYIVFTLLLANLVYFGWRFLSPAQEVVSAVAAPIDKSQIKLIDDEPIMDEAESVASNAPSTPTEVQSTIEVQPSPENTLSKEVTSDDANQVTPTIAMPDVVSEPIPAPVLSCYITPWTRDEKQRDQWLAQTRDADVETLQQEIETQRRFLIYIPPKESATKTLERLREIKKLPIDSAHINNGEFVGGISLGLFSQEESAQGVLKKAHDLGLHDAKKTVRVLTATEWRLRVRQRDNLSAPWELCAE